MQPIVYQATHDNLQLMPDSSLRRYIKPAYCCATCVSGIVSKKATVSNVSNFAMVVEQLFNCLIV